jgi:hypothetical protein
MSGNNIMMRRRTFLSLAASRLAANAFAPPQLLPPWRAGMLDLHHISTGKGNCTFVKAPDGTTLMIDAGATSRSGRVARQYPNSERTVGAWIADYVRAVEGPDARVDSLFLTHFHGDHMGEPSSDSAKSPDGPWVLTGITEVASLLPIGQILDRGWPDYGFPAPIRSRPVTNYREFLRAFVAKGGEVQRIRPGSASQIVLRHDPSRYPTFTVRPVAANGVVWTGKGEETRNCFPPLSSLPKGELPEENVCSASILISYGKFRYFQGGDTNGFLEYGTPRWHDMETPIAEAIGKIDVNHASHHGYVDGVNERFLALTQPRVHIISAWSPTHPAHSTLLRMTNRRIYPGDRSIYSTNTMDEARFVVGPPMDQIRSHHGHIVIRVEPGGSEYRVYIRNNKNTTREVTLCDGPFLSS